ncbi:hypothetical protein [Leptolyngbya sp. 7M]|uniref:hypothetical protein n=1 Tax=Leptolyngbya sp. 7M TaxID=2812896 RepID=UPI001B8A8FDC|nr:hypothetical protein [Leptolyngbya sp. 7M]QYO66130.1 hypothetical protein JVX88_04845 [Leptolyngbya sp. 7M]
MLHSKVARQKLTLDLASLVMEEKLLPPSQGRPSEIKREIEKKGPANRSEECWFHQKISAEYWSFR